MALTQKTGPAVRRPHRARTCRPNSSYLKAFKEETARRAPLPASAPFTLTEIHGIEERTLPLLDDPSQPPLPAPPLQPTHRPLPLLLSPPSLPPLTALPSLIRELFLPPGFPSSVTPDYLCYQLWSLPTHVTGHLSHALVTSSLLSAVGVSTPPAATVALSASIKWIVKDGVGALGRLIIGSRFSAEFDEDPRRWRVVAELLSSVGLGLEVATCLQPAYFLQLACAGKFCQALGKGMGKPVFRVIQTHFARAGNVGAVAAKEEVWEVVAQMAGLAGSVAVLRALEGTGSSDGVVPTWAAIQTLHVALRVTALQQLAFPSLSLKRTAMLASAAVRGRPMPSVAAGNAAEPLLGDAWAVRPRIRLGCATEEAFGGVLPAGSVLREYVEAYDREGYLLVWWQGGESGGDDGGGDGDGAAYVVLKEGHSGRDLVRAVWQAAWLEYWHNEQQQQGKGEGEEVTVAAAGTVRMAESPVAVAVLKPGSDGERICSRGVHEGATAKTISPGRGERDEASGVGGGDERDAGEAVGPDVDRSAEGGSEGPAVGGGGSWEGGALKHSQQGQELQLVRRSLSALESGFEGFEAACVAAGWEVGTVHMKTGRSRLRVRGSSGTEDPGRCV